MYAQARTSVCGYVTPPDSQEVLNMFQVGVKTVFGSVYDRVTVQPLKHGEQSPERTWAR